MCIENRELYSACAHVVPLSVDHCSFGGPHDVWTARQACMKHQIYLTVYPGFCATCCSEILLEYAQVGFQIARSLVFISEFWTGQATKEDIEDDSDEESDDGEAGKRTLGEQPIAGAIRADVDFEANGHWKRALENGIVGCFPEAIKMGDFLWPCRSWVPRDDEDRGHLAELVRGAQARTIRWAAGFDPDTL
ncbi:hypothetical protein DCS_04917 [Drechmeria coniospora]|uniref:Uncharacterized protein n=1 Tax=Drechmeria coniospora TaxID=98403 RepID=A0A151GLB8_DRECN|nr:hypothetical protein DCS_04917 [Drechmeria coniospora]KYK57904.1 hypothetical protein DCS_04917 [Drechmeria coniospora]ODA83255.1 hypothetical protein RJ55_01767 [Drechmeria coniospora]